MFTREHAKRRSTQLRTILKSLGYDITHAHALEVTARQSGYRDWNACAAAMDIKAQLAPLPPDWVQAGDRRESYDFGIDRSLSYQGEHPMVIRYKVSEPQDATGFATSVRRYDVARYAGQRVQFSAVLKCADCEGAVTIWARADGDEDQSLAFDNLEDRSVGAPDGPITGDTDWTLRSILLDVPKDAAKLLVGFYIRGKGAGYAAKAELSIVAQDVLPTP